MTTVLAQFFVSRKLVVYGDAVNLIAYAFYIVLTVLFYYMFKPVNRSLSLLAAFFSLVGCTIGVLDVFHLAPSHVSPLLFFGFYCLLIGYLIFRSTFLPRPLGWLMAFAGLGWLAFLSPPIAMYLSLYIEVLGILAEASLMLLAAGDGRERSRMEGAGHRSRGIHAHNEAGPLNARYYLLSQV